MIVAEEFGEWEDSRRRIDLLGIDRSANLVVIELKRTEDGGHMELQAIRYAAMISTLTFENLVPIYERFLAANQIERDATESLLEFLGWGEPDEELFGQEVKIILASAEFSKELTTAVMWLNDFRLDIRCVRMHPYISGGQTDVPGCADGYSDPGGGGVSGSYSREEAERRELYSSGERWSFPLLQPHVTHAHQNLPNWKGPD